MFSPKNLHNEHLLLTAHCVMLSDLSAQMCQSFDFFPISVLYSKAINESAWNAVTGLKSRGKKVMKYQPAEQIISLKTSVSGTHLT